MFNPTLCCLNKTGLPSVKKIIKLIMNMTGDNITNANKEIKISKYLIFNQ